MLVSICLAGCTSREEIVVFAAASAEEAVAEAGALFARKTGVGVVVSAGGSVRLRRQIERGARADVYVAAGPAGMEGESRGVAINRLVAIVPRGSTLRDWRRARKIAVGDPDLAPAGAYAERVLRREGVTADRVRCAHVRAVLAYVELGLVDAGFVYRTDATGRVRIVEVFPEKVEYEAVVVRDRPAARRFLKHLAESRALFRRRGFE